MFLAAILFLLFMPKQWCLQLVIRQKWIQHLKIIEKQRYFSSKMPTASYPWLFIYFGTRLHCFTHFHVLLPWSPWSDHRILLQHT